MNDNGIDKQIEKMVTKKFQKWAIIGGLSLFGFVFVVAFLVAVMQMFSIDNVFNAISNAVEGVEITIDKTINFLTGQGFVATENEAYNNLMVEQYENYHESDYSIGELDSALIAATLNYGKVISPEMWLDGAEIDETDTSENDSATPSADVTFDSQNSEDFYRWATIWVGDYLSPRPYNRGLTGALVSTRVTYSCESEEQKLSDSLNEFDYKISQALTGVDEGFESFFGLISGDTFKNYLSTARTTGNGYSIDKILSGYYDTVIEIADYENADIYGYTVEDAYYLSEDYKECEPFTYVDNDGYEVTEEMYLHVNFQIENNYTQYNKYLEEFFIPNMYLDCANCSMKDYNWSEGEKEEKIQSIINEIYAQKDAYNQMAGIEVATFNADNCPLDKETIVLTSRFGVYRPGLDAKGTFHSGLDFGSVTTADGVYAIADGIVSFAGYSSSYGYNVRILHADGTTSLYAHLSQLTTLAGASVEGGEQIGFVGSTGNSTGNHLHLELRAAPNPSLGYQSMWDLVIDPRATIDEVCGGRNIIEGGYY